MFLRTQFEHDWEWMCYLVLFVLFFQLYIILGYEICREKNAANTKRSPDSDHHSEGQESLLVRWTLPCVVQHVHFRECLIIIVSPLAFLLVAGLRSSCGSSAQRIIWSLQEGTSSRMRWLSNDTSGLVTELTQMPPLTFKSTVFKTELIMSTICFVRWYLCSRWPPWSN